MRQINFPTGFVITSSTLELSNPSQIVFRSQSDQTQVLNRGYQIWRGSLTIDDHNDTPTPETMEKFLAALNGQENFTIIPHDRRLPDLEEFIVTSVNPADPNDTNTFDTYGISLVNRRDTGIDIVLPDRLKPFAIWMSDEVIYVKGRGSVKAFNKGNRVSIPTLDIDTSTEIPEGNGLWTRKIWENYDPGSYGGLAFLDAMWGDVDNNILYVLSNNKRMIYAYNISGDNMATYGDHIPTKDITLETGTDRSDGATPPVMIQQYTYPGLFGNGDYLWVIYSDTDDGSRNNIRCHYIGNTNFSYGARVSTLDWIPTYSVMVNDPVSGDLVSEQRRGASGLAGDAGNFYTRPSRSIVNVYDYEIDDSNPAAPTIDVTLNTGKIIDISRVENIPEGRLYIRSMHFDEGVLFLGEAGQNIFYAIDVSGGALSQIRQGDFYYALGRCFRVSTIDSVAKTISFVPEVPVPENTRMQRTLGIPANIVSGYSTTITPDWSNPWNLVFVEKLNATINSIQDFNADREI